MRNLEFALSYYSDDPSIRFLINIELLIAATNRSPSVARNKVDWFPQVSIPYKR